MAEEKSKPEAEEPKQFIIPQNVLDEIKADLIDELKNNTERLIITDSKSGATIELESQSQTMIDLINDALLVKQNFFKTKSEERGYIN